MCDDCQNSGVVKMMAAAHSGENEPPPPKTEPMPTRMAEVATHLPRGRTLADEDPRENERIDRLGLQEQHAGNCADAGESVGERETGHDGSRHRYPEQAAAIPPVKDESQLALELENREGTERREHDGAGTEEQGVEMNGTPSRDYRLAGAEDRVDDAERQADLECSGATGGFVGSGDG